MQFPRPSKTTLSFLLPMLILPMGMLMLSIMAVTKPVAVLPKTEETPPEAVRTSSESRSYHAFIAPLTVSLPENAGTLSVQLGVALPQRDGQSLEKILQDSPDAVLGNLATALLDAVEIADIRGDPIQLRALMPEVLKTAMNTNLVEMGEPPDILEVLIIDWALLQ